MRDSSITMMAALVCLGILFAMIPTGHGINCYDDTCTETLSGRPCKTDSSEFGRTDKKFNCRTGCRYWTINDRNGRPIPGQPYKIRECWDAYYDGGDKLKDGTCTETHGDNGRVDRMCVCASDWCNGPEQDRVWDAMSSGPKLGQVNSFWVLGALGVVAYTYARL